MNNEKGKKRSQKLRVLLRKEYGEWIQEGEHDSIEDARAALLLYRKHRVEWEKRILNKNRRNLNNIVEKVDESLLKE